MRFATKNQETTSFKKRYSLSYRRHKLLFGEFAFSLLKSYNIEYIYIYNFKKKLKKFFFFKKSRYKRVWLFLHKNYPLTKKSKNARMGKGKGSVVRYCSRICRNHNLFEFTGFGIVELMSLKRVFSKKIQIPLKIHTNFFFRKSYNIGSCVEKFFFFKRYGS
jgi:ribosomal protein L16/L10AE